MNSLTTTTSLAIALFAIGMAALSAAEESPRTREEMVRMTKVQLFLDQENFRPGKIDGRWGEFTRKALLRYREAHELPPQVYGDEPPASFALPLEKVDPVFIAYWVTGADGSAIGNTPSEPAEQARQKALPYGSILELVAERFHADRDFLRELNPGKNLDDLEAGEWLTVPNVRHPFYLSLVEERAAADRKAAEKAEEEKKAAKEAAQRRKSGEGKADASEQSEAPQPPAFHIDIDVSEKMLALKKHGKLVASFPITPGSESLPAPQGEWKIVAIAFMPWFRYDKKMLMEGERSSDAYDIPPGPNNAVGIAWMALNKTGIGIHGTGEPGTIGRSSSHGCIRLSNWDAWELARTVEAGTPVTIH